MPGAERDQRRVVSPIVIGSDDGLALFASVDVACGYIEGIDVENGVYGPGYDAIGHRVRIGVPSRSAQSPAPRWARWRSAFSSSDLNDVDITVDLDAPPDTRGLVALLQERLHDERADLQDLIGTALDRFHLHE